MWKYKREDYDPYLRGLAIQLCKQKGRMPFESGSTETQNRFLWQDFYPLAEQIHTAASEEAIILQGAIVHRLKRYREALLKITTCATSKPNSTVRKIIAIARQALDEDSE